jgi:hypothetical protein
MRFQLTFWAVLFATVAMAQPRPNSPYSRFGLGDPQPQYFANQAGMAGMTAAFHDPYHLNIANPASFAFLRATSFETGLYGRYGHYESANNSQDAWTGNLGYLALGFTLKSPINEALDRDKKLWKHGMGFSLTPVQQVGYNVISRDTLPDLGIVQSEFRGNGATYRLAWHGASRYKQTAFGATAGWQFGNTSYSNVTSFIDSFINYQNVFRDNFRARGFVWNLGVQHDIVLKYAENDKSIPTKWITIGATGEGSHNINAVADVLRMRARGLIPTTGAYEDADTLIYEQGANRKLRLPATFTAGIQYVNADKLKVGAQFGLDNWANYKNELRPESLRNTFSVSAGVEWIPEWNSYNHYMRRMRYRAGAYYRQDPRSVNGTNLDDMGITLGFGCPLILPRQQASFINMAFEAGRIGANSPIEETYVRITLGFTLNDNSWFFKRRFE